jgi:hypothetical protein
MSSHSGDTWSFKCCLENLQLSPSHTPVITAQSIAADRFTKLRGSLSGVKRKSGPQVHLNE